MDLDSDIQSSSKIETTIPRQLVLDYLLHNCYGETARAFMKDDLDAARDSEAAHASQKNHSISNGNHAHAHSHGNGASHNHSQTHRGGVMTRSASSTDDLGNTTKYSSNGNSSNGRTDDAVSVMDTDKSEELDQEGDSPMADSFQDSTANGRVSQSTGAFSTDKMHAAHIDEQLKNLETRKGKK